MKSFGKRCYLVAMLSPITLTVTGCLDDAPQIAPAVGKVTFNGEPLPGAAVVNFVSDKGFSSRFDVTSDGEFSLRSEFGPGIPPGNYRVSITPPLPQLGASKEHQAPADTSYVPQKYRCLDTSGFVAKITEDGGGPFVFDMTE